MFAPLASGDCSVSSKGAVSRGSRSVLETVWFRQGAAVSTRAPAGRPLRQSALPPGVTPFRSRRSAGPRVAAVLPRVRELAVETVRWRWRREPRFRGASAIERLDHVLWCVAGSVSVELDTVGVQSEAVAVDAVVRLSNVRADWSGGRVVAMLGGRPGAESQRAEREATIAVAR